MPWVREGHCNQCGKCCIELMGYRPMLNDDGICKYLKDGKCTIQEAVPLNFEHLDYWRCECVPYPDPDNKAHVPPKHELLKGCGFKMVWRDD